jgi:uncharacterized protein (TIGR04255 family)
MKLPKQIIPSLVVQIAVEFRIKTDLREEDLLIKYYPIFNNSKIRQLTPTHHTAETDTVKNAPLYLFTWDNYGVSVGINSILFEITGEYSSWMDYCQFIIEKIKKIQSLNIIQAINRIGVRYSNIIPDHFVVEDVLNVNPIINSDYNSRLQLANSILRNEDLQFVIQIAANANYSAVVDTKKISGILIDIDGSCESIEGFPFKDNIIEKMNSIQSQEKVLFFSLLKENYLNTLNPIYG